MPAKRRITSAKAEPSTVVEMTEQEKIDAYGVATIDADHIGSVRAYTIESGTIGDSTITVHGPMTIYDESGFAIGCLAPADGDVGLRLRASEPQHASVMKALEASMARPGQFGGAASFTVGGPQADRPQRHPSLGVLALLERGSDQANKTSNYAAAHALSVAAQRLGELRNCMAEALKHCDGTLFCALQKISEAL